MKQNMLTIFGNNINTDDIISGRFLRTSNITDWKENIFIDYDNSLKIKIQQNPLILAGYKFGCGSSREQAVLALKMNGVNCILAISFGKIFYRNCINNGIWPISITESDYRRYSDNECITEDELFLHKTFPIVIKDILEADGILGLFKAKNIKNNLN